MSEHDGGARAPEHFLIVFGDITRFQAHARGMPDVELAETMDEFYRCAGAAVRASRGRIIKFIGDAFLAVWSAADASRGAASLPTIKGAVDAFFVARKWESRLVLKAHYGEAIAGPYGEDMRFDLIGNQVNIAATLPSRTIALTPEAFRLLSPDERRSWKKHTVQVIYFPEDDPRP